MFGMVGSHSGKIGDGEDDAELLGKRLREIEEWPSSDTEELEEEHVRLIVKPWVCFCETWVGYLHQDPVIDEDPDPYGVNSMEVIRKEKESLKQRQTRFMPKKVMTKKGKGKAAEKDFQEIRERSLWLKNRVTPLQEREWVKDYSSVFSWLCELLVDVVLEEKENTQVSFVECCHVVWIGSVKPIAHSHNVSTEFCSRFHKNHLRNMAAVRKVEEHKDSLKDNTVFFNRVAGKSLMDEEEDERMTACTLSNRVSIAELKEWSATVTREDVKKTGVLEMESFLSQRGLALSEALGGKKKSTRDLMPIPVIVKARDSFAWHSGMLEWCLATGELDRDERRVMLVEEELRKRKLE